MGNKESTWWPKHLLMASVYAAPPMHRESGQSLSSYERLVSSLVLKDDVLIISCVCSVCQ